MSATTTAATSTTTAAADGAAAAAAPVATGPTKQQIADAWKTYLSNDGRPYYHNMLTKETSWIKPQEIVEREKKLKAWEETLKNDPIWEKKRDRFGRDVYYNKETKQTQMDKPYHWWTEEEKEIKRKAEEYKKKEEEEKKRKADEAREQRTKPRIKQAIVELKKATDGKATAEAEKIKAGKETALPLAGMFCGDASTLASLYKGGKFSLVEYDARRTPSSSSSLVDEKSEGEQLVYTLFQLSLDWSHEATMDKAWTQWELKILHIIALYTYDTFFLYDNFITLPCNPMDALFDVRYYKQQLPLGDLILSGYDARRVTPDLFAEASKKRDQELEQADESKKVICTDEQWSQFWSKKVRAKEEMYRALKLRALGIEEGYQDLMDGEEGEEGEE